MAHYAFLDENNIVTEVITGVHENIIQTDTDGTQVGGSSEAWEIFYGNFRGQTCKRTSYNTYQGKRKDTDEPGFRKNYASIGYIYDEVRDAFIPNKLYESWILNETTCDWDPPVPYPTDGYTYLWNEASLSWVIVEL